MFKKLINNFKIKYNNIKEENDHYKELLNTTTTLKQLTSLPTSSEKTITEYIINFITTNSLDINENKANIIAKTIPLEETYLAIYYAKEILTNKEIFIVPTNLKLWIINTEEYMTLPYDNLQISIIKNNIMSKTILFNNVLLEINGNTEKINKLITIINNPQERQNIIVNETKYLCGIIPTYQMINSIKSGISLDKENNIVIHTKEFNYKCNINDITNYEILLDNQCYYSKNNNTKKIIPSFSNSYSQISLEITIQNNNHIIIPILEQDTQKTKYQIQNTFFQNNLNFAITLIKKLEELSN